MKKELNHKGLALKPESRLLFKLVFWGILDLLLAGLLIVLVGSWVFGALSLHKGYEYSTVSGEIGDATFCHVRWGKPHCYTEDGRFVMVEGFKKK